MRIDGKRAVVTGGAVGIGRAIALRLAAAGAEVVVADIDVAGGSRTCELIGSSARFVQVDMRDDAAVTDLMACQPQILVNNAGGGAALPVAERGPELVPLEVLTDAVVRFVEDESLAGRVVLLDRGAEPRFLE